MMQSESMVSLDDIIIRFNPYEASIEYNPHKGMHQTIPEYFGNMSDIVDMDRFIDYDECIRDNAVYSVRVYPHTCVGFYEIHSRYLDKALNRMIEALKNDK